MGDESQFWLGAMAQKEAALIREQWGNPWLPQKRSFLLDGASGDQAHEERAVLQRMTMPDRRPSSLAAVAPTSPSLLHELFQMSDGWGCRLGSSSQAPPVVSSSPIACKGAASLFAIQSNDDASCPACSPTLELDSNSSPLPYGWEKCLDLQTGSIYYLNRATGLTTSVDPRAAPPSSSTAFRTQFLNTMWAPPPASPTSASSDITFEGVPRPSCTIDGAGWQWLSAPSAAKAQVEALASIPAPATSPDEQEEPDLDLRLSLRPSGGSLQSKFHCRKQLSEASTRARPLDEQRQKQPWQHDRAAAAKLQIDGACGDDDAEKCGMSVSSMITGACSYCLMFVMVPRTPSPKCPRCGSFIDNNTPGSATAPGACTVSSEQTMAFLSPPPAKKAKLLFPPALSLESPHSTVAPAATVV